MDKRDNKNQRNIRKDDRLKSRKTNGVQDRYSSNIRPFTLDARNTAQRNLRQNLNKAKAPTSKPRRKPRKKRNTHILSKIFTTSIFIMVILYFGIYIYKSLNKKPVDYQVLGYGTIENQKTAKGIIIRDETVYKASKDGILNFYKTEYEKVKKGQEIVAIKDQEAIKNTEQELEEINKKILEMQETRGELSLFSEDIKRVEGQIQSILDQGIYKLSENNFSSTYELKDALQKKIDIKSQMLLSENGGSIEDLANQRNIKEKKINSNTQVITNSEGGILSYYTDGLEDTFSIDKIEQLTKEQTKMEADKLSEIGNYRVQVLENEPVFKIVTSNVFYIASYIKTAYIENWKEGQFKNIYIKKSGKYFPLEVNISKIVLEDKESYVLMKSTKNIIDFIEDRGIVFEINKPKEGFKININAIAEENLIKVPIAYILEDTIIKKGEKGNVNISIETAGIDETGEFAYIPIKLGILNIGDTVINNDLKQEYVLKDLFTTKGIYVINTGIYTFKRISLENSIQNDNFIILDPSVNSNIKIYDRFVPDAKIVQPKGQVYN